jgi:diguanylate cyclase (GGDEF)-like protein
MASLGEVPPSLKPGEQSPLHWFMETTQTSAPVSPLEQAAALADDSTVLAPGLNKRNFSLSVKRFELLCSQLPSVAIGSLTTAILVALLLYSFDPALPIATWLGSIVAVSVLRVAQLLLYRRALITENNVSRWSTGYSLCNFAAGVSWGTLMLVPELSDFRQATTVIIVLGGILAAAGVLYAASLRAFFAFATPTLAMITYGVWSQAALAGLVPLMAAYGLLLASAASRTARALTKSLSIQLENVDLLDSLQEERDRFRLFNAVLESRVSERTSELSTSNTLLQQEIEERDKVQRKLLYQASHDPLTSLYNRTEFETRIQQIVTNRRRDRQPHAVCCMDLDQFKLVNDTCGHGAGDELLRRLSGMLAAQVRTGDVLARLGGDEFGILLYDAGLNESMQLIERLRDMIENFTFLWDRRQFKVTASFGVAILTDDYDYDSVTDVLRDADTACFLAKDRGRNCVHVHVQDDATVSERRQQMAWINRLDAAMADKRLLLARQPIIDCSGKGVPHWEILLRLRDEDGDIVTPGFFLPAAERFGMMPRIDRFVVEQVTDYIAVDADGEDCYAINLSGNSLGDERLISFIHERVKQCAKPSRLCFEITETAAISNLTQVSDIIRELRQLGCRFSLDDFGTGMASFDYLRSLPVDFLKIDGSFIKDIVDNPISLAMVRAVNDIAHLMGMRTIAEFVENQQIAALLRDIDIDYLQGFAFGRPQLFMPADLEKTDPHSIHTVQFVVNG